MCKVSSSSSGPLYHLGLRVPSRSGSTKVFLMPEFLHVLLTESLHPVPELRPVVVPGPVFKSTHLGQAVWFIRGQNLCWGQCSLCFSLHEQDHQQTSELQAGSSSALDDLLPFLALRLSSNSELELIATLLLLDLLLGGLKRVLDPEWDCHLEELRVQCIPVWGWPIAVGRAMVSQKTCTWFGCQVPMSSLVLEQDRASWSQVWAYSWQLTFLLTEKGFSSFPFWQHESGQCWHRLGNSYLIQALLLWWWTLLYYSLYLSLLGSHGWFR